MDTRPKSTRTRKSAAPDKPAPARPRSRSKSAVTDAGQPAPTHDQIAQRAHELYVRSGYAQGREQEFWLEAERQLLDEARSVAV